QKTFCNQWRINGARWLQGKMSGSKLIFLRLIVVNGGNQIVITADRKKVKCKAPVAQNIRIGMGVLIQSAHHGKESGLVSVKTTPTVKTDVRLTVFLPGGDGKQHLGNSSSQFKMGEQLKFLRIRG